MDVPGTGDSNQGVVDECFALRCNGAKPICVVKDDGSAACVKDTCLGTVCAAGKTCQIDSNGNARCIPQAGTATTDTSSGCKNGGCVSSTSVDPCLAPGVCPTKTSCTVDKTKKKAVCVATASAAPIWWDLVTATYVNNDLASCEKRNNIAPADGARCDKPKTCFFGNQECSVVGPYPTARCRCVRGKWKCNRDVRCPARMNDKIN